GALTPTYYADPTLLVNAPAAPPVQLGFVGGNQLVIDPASNFAGTFEVIATTTNPDGSASRSFKVTVTNATPTLDVINDQSMSHAQPSLTVGLSGADADGDNLTFNAVLPAQVARTLDQQLGLSSIDNSYFNYGSRQDKWILGSGGQWYFLLPDGSFY